MKRLLIVAPLALALYAGFSVGAFGTGQEPVVLDAVVGANDSFTIALNDSSGKLVKRLAPGTYTIVVHDLSAIHNFHLASNEDSSVDFRTDVAFVGDQTFTVTFKDGVQYAYACEPHWRLMFNSFAVTSAPLATTTTKAPPKPKPKPKAKPKAKKKPKKKPKHRL
jgi:hypothetical protein